MASNKRKQDEKHLKTLREMVALPINKQCFDCHQRGPTYVNMTIGSFVCTSCSGILRGLNPPHRVKSISMASFTPEEMDFLKCHGNELNRKVYLGLYDSRSWPEPDSRDEQRVRDYMVQKYENKRWYVAPTEAMKEDAKRANEAAMVSKPQAKPLRSMLGENASRLVNHAPVASHTNSALQPPPVKAVSSPSLPGPHAPATTAHPAAAPVPAAAARSDGFDLLGELGGDPFASNTPAAPVTNNVSGGGFADFSNFGNFNSTSTPPQVAPSLPPQSSLPPNPAFPISNTPLVPMGTNSSAVAPTPASATATQNKNQAPASGMSAGDRYAALADLDSAFSAPTTTATSINWAGPDFGPSGGALNWGGNSGAPANPTSQSSSSMGGWGSNGGGGAAINWNNQPSNAVPSMGTSPVSSGFGAPPSTAANPFGTSQAPSFSTPAVSSNPNPFGVSSTAGFGAAPAAAAPPAFQAQSGFGQFPPMQNGGFGMPLASNAGFGAPAGAAQGMGVFPGQQPQQQPQQQAFMMQQQQQPQQVGMGGWGAMGAQMGAQQQPSANPFMSAAMQQQHVPPPSGATNPFL